MKSISAVSTMAPGRLRPGYGGAVRDYLVALAAVAAMTLVGWPLQPLLGDRVPYLTIFGAVAIAVWFGGWKAALFAAVTGFIAANYFIIEPTFAFQSSLVLLLELAGYALSAGLIIFFGESMNRMHDRAEQEAVSRSQAESSERHQKELLHATLSSIGDGVIVTDPSGRVRTLNTEACRLTGWSAADAFDRPLADVFRIVNELDGKPAPDPVDLVLRDDAAVGLAGPIVLISIDGTRTSIGINAAPIREPPGPLLGMVIVFRDVSRELAAHRAQAQLAAIVQHSGEAIATKSLDGVIQTWNASAEKLFGYTAREIVGKPVTVLLPPDRLHEESDILNRMRMGRPVERFETIRVTKDGRHIPVAVSVSPIRDDDGRVVGASKLVRDISDVVAAREALAQEHELLATTLASIGDGVITTDARGRITYLNSVAEHTLGRALDDVVGEPIERVFRVIDESTRQPVENPSARALRRGTRTDSPDDSILLRKNGEERTIDATAAPIHNRDGDVAGCVMVFRDVSERRHEKRRAESEIERLLANERRARAEVEQINRMKDEFLATLSHELRTPLNAILGFSQLIQKNPGDLKGVKEGIQVIRRNAQVQVDLISDLLDMSRIISGKLRLDVQDVSMAEVVSAGVDAIRHSAQTKDILIDTDLPEDDVFSRGDAGRLQQVVWNLLSNAVKFTPRRGRIRVILQADSTSAQIVVEDTGIGIPADVLPHLFERFRQADSSAARAHGGLGIGLAIVKHLVELHGGTVYAASEGEGRGASFTVELPLVTERPAAHESDGAQLEAVAAALEEDRVDLTGLSVLAIDDQEDSRAFLARVLEGHNARVIGAASAEEGMFAVKKHHPGIVLCDIGMPGADGYQFIKELRESGDDTPALAVTAFARAEDRLRALRAGYQAHIAKPVDPAELLATIAVFIEQRR